MRYDVLDRCQEGDIDTAIASCIACFHAGSSLGDEPTAISMLVRIACQAVAVSLIERTLAQGEASPAMLAELQKRLEAEEPAPILLFATRGERAMSNHYFENLRSGNLGPNPVTGVIGGGGGGATALLDWVAMLPGFVSSQQAGCVRFMNKMVETARLPPEEWAPRFTAAPRRDPEPAGPRPAARPGDGQDRRSLPPQSRDSPLRHRRNCDGTLSPRQRPVGPSRSQNL